MRKTLPPSRFPSVRQMVVESALKTLNEDFSGASMEAPEKNRRFVVEYRMKDGGITYGQIVAPSISAVLHVYRDIEGRDENDIIAIVDAKQSKIGL